VERWSIVGLLGFFCAIAVFLGVIAVHVVSRPPIVVNCTDSDCDADLDNQQRVRTPSLPCPTYEPRL
jgi:hypothetical protein